MEENKLDGFNKDSMEIMVIIPNHWAKGSSISEAKENLKKISGSFRYTKDNHKIWIVGKSTVLNEMGDFRSDRGEIEPIEIS